MGIGISVDVHSKLGIEVGGARRAWCWPASRSVDGFPLAKPESGQAQAATTQHSLERVALSFLRVASGSKGRLCPWEGRRVQKEAKRSRTSAWQVSRKPRHCAHAGLVSKIEMRRGQIEVASSKKPNVNGVAPGRGQGQAGLDATRWKENGMCGCKWKWQAGNLEKTRSDGNWSSHLSICCCICLHPLQGYLEVGQPRSACCGGHLKPGTCSFTALCSC